MKVYLFILTIIFFCPKLANAAIYYVDNTLESDCFGDYSITNRSCTGVDGNAYNDLYDVNQIVTAGDTVYLRGGTDIYEIYNVTAASGPGEGIQPDNSGTNYTTGLITYSTYNDEMVHLQGNCDTNIACQNLGGIVGIKIYEKSYIKVTGSINNKLKVSKCFRNLEIGASVPSTYARYNEIAYVWGTDTNLDSSWGGTWAANIIHKNSQYNHVHHCKFERHGSQSSSDLFVVGMAVNWTDSDISLDRYNVIEDCEFSSGGHSTFFPGGMYNVYRNNYMHNEAWTSVGESFLYGFRNTINHQDYGNAGHNLFEGNRIGHATRGPSSPYGTGGVHQSNSNDMMRYNDFFNNGGEAFEFRASDYANNYYVRSNNNYLYNNTFYYNGHNEGEYTSNGVIRFGYSSKIDLYTAIPIYWQATQNNVIKNNLFYDNYNNQRNESVYGGSDISDAQACPSSQVQGCNIISNNYNDNVGENIDPLFVDETLDLYESWTLPNLNLQPASPVIDKGASLTQANNSGISAKSLIVQDSFYFQDGKFGVDSGCDPSKWSADIDIQADWIAIGNVDNTVQIESINYPSNTITLASSMTWLENDPIYLYKKSDGDLVLYGEAPDIGAHERVDDLEEGFRADANGDSSIDIVDALLVLRKSFGLDMSGTDWQISDTTGDVNCDGTVSVVDALLTFRKSLNVDMTDTTWCVGQ